jgi:acyl-CoA synthetase (AMP-forming)/AMP-acid ligase II
MSFNLATILTETTLAAPDAPACLVGGTTISYRELDEQSGRLAASLRSAGLAPGRVVALQLPDGFYFIVDRAKDLVIRGGYNVYPREVEEVLYAHPSVLEAAVIGKPDQRLGEEVVGVVVRRPGCELSADEIIAYCRERLAAYKYPREIRFMAELPKGPSGKILKSALREG